MVEMVTRRDVPLLETGREYVLSTGPKTFTEEDLRAAVAAVERDPAVKAPRVKIDGLAASFDPEAHGGEPAFGTVGNMRVVNGGQTLVGDVTVPRWIDDVMDWAYPSRSIEGMCGVQTVTGQSHELVITHLALLGVDLPGVSTIADLEELLTQNGPIEEPTAIAARAPQYAGALSASLDSDIVVRRFYDELGEGGYHLTDSDGDETAPWCAWVRSLRFDDDGSPYIVVQDDDDGDLFRINFTVSGNDVSFAEPQQVVEQYVAASSGASPARALPGEEVLRIRDEARVAAEQAAGQSAESTEEAPVDIALLRARLGLSEEQLPDDASDDQINAALQPAEPGAEPEAAAGPEPEAAPEPEPVAARALPEGTQIIDSEELERLRRAAQTAEQLAAQAAREERDRTVRAAIGEGRFPPSRREHYERMWDRDPEGTRSLLTASAADGGLAPNSVPVREIGQQREVEGAEAERAEHEAYMQRMNPAIAAKLREKAERSGRVLHQTEA